MRIITLGTSAGRPTLSRSATAVALEYEGEVLLFDCGEGTQIQLSRSPLRWGSISAIFIGHLHGDHVNGLPGLLASFSLSERTSPLKVFGPAGIKKYLQVLKECRNLWISFPCEIIEVQSAGLILNEKKYQVFTHRLDHIIECWGYVFREKDRPGHFNEEKASQLKIPVGPVRAQLVQGKEVTLSDGRIIRPQEVVGPPRPGRSVAYCLDTKPCEGDLQLARGVDLLIHESTFDDSVRAEIATWGHSTCVQAAEIAREAKSRELLLTHISPRYPEATFLLEQASEVFEKTLLASDLSEFMIKEKDK